MVPVTLTVAVDPAGIPFALTVIPTGVEFPPQAATQEASSAVTPNLHDLILTPPSLLTAIDPPFSRSERLSNLDNDCGLAIRKSGPL